MQTDPIVEEIRKVRELRAARFGYDVRLIVKDAQVRDASGDWEVVHLQPRRPLSSVQGNAEAIKKRCT
jgi:hypothetical protein